MEIRERANRYGIESLEDNEILSLLSSKKNFNATEFIEKEADVVSTLNNLSIRELTQYFGSNAYLIKALFEINKRKSKQKTQIKGCADAFNYIKRDIMYAENEEFVAIFLNTKSFVITSKVMFKGGKAMAIVDVSSIMATALRLSASQIIVAHNHPSGDPTPSQEDIKITTRIKNAGDILGIVLLDHIIIGDNCYISLKGKNLI